MHDANLLEDQPIAWTPTPETIERAQLTKFMRQIGVSTWDELYEFSIRDVEKFTEEVLKFLDIKFDPLYEKLLDLSDGVEFPNWFGRSADTPVRTSTTPNILEKERHADNSVRTPTSAGLNITEMCLDRWVERGHSCPHDLSEQPAVIWEGEEGIKFFDTYEDLHWKVESIASGLRFIGIKVGDAVAIHLPMMIETVVALLAINRIGAIAVPVFSGYGVEAIASRINAVQAKALFTCDGFPRRGKFVNAFETAREAVKRCPTIEKVVCVGRMGSDWTFPDDRYVDWHNLFSFEFFGVPNEEWEDLHFPEPTSAEDPLIILYTSGTTGKPKGIAHTHASFPIKAAQDMAFGTDVGKGTRISWYTDIGWMMGPWLIYGALINGATICIYDGAPDYPTPDRMWEFCARHKVEVLGISPTLIRSLAASEQRSADTPVRTSTPSNVLEEAKQADKSVRAPSPSERRGWHSRGYLPHFDGEVTQFITFRLADSLPKKAIERIKAELAQENRGGDSREYRIRVEKHIDQGAGSCILRDPAIAAILEETILREHGHSCLVKAWVIMPNHGHLLLRALDGFDLSGIMQRIKGISARKINKYLGRDDSVWQADYFDRFIRDEEHFTKAVRYIHRNPVMAGLCEEPEDWRFSSANTDAIAKFDDRRSADTPVRTSTSSITLEEEIQADKSVRPPFQRHDLSSLRIFASTGEPWNPAPWWWLFEKVGNSKLPIINYSGGTEIAGGILMGNPLLPIKPCSFPAPCPGMDVDILDEDGNSVEPGKVGELVIKQPWIGMARGFWQEKERYLDTYWRRFKDIWVHGDFAMRDKDGHWFILGRSDDTLKIAGKRVGPAEVESLLVAHPQVTEAAVIGVPDEVKGTAMVAFVVRRSADTPVRTSTSPNKLEEGRPADKSVRPPLEDELKALVAKDMGKPLAPSKILFVSALPKTRNAKVMRRVIRSAYLGEDPGDLSALEDPTTIDAIRKSNPDVAS